MIDAAGQVVAPGFIDVLSYSPNAYGIWRKLEDGVTTNLAMHGASADMGAWYRSTGRSRWPINYGGAFSNPNARERLGISRYRATAGNANCANRPRRCRKSPSLFCRMNTASSRWRARSR